jgi:GTP-binding protein HflX
VLADTVGFVRDLPHDLVAAFRSTLSEARDADLLLHVIDAHDPHREDRISQVNAVLDEIDAASIPQIEVWNKIDLVEGGEPRIERIDGGRRIRVHASARDGRGLDLVRDAIGDVLSGARVSGRVLLPHSAGRLRARLFELGVVAAESADDQGWTLDIDAPAQLLAPLLGGTDPEAGRLRDALVLNDPDA